MASNNQSIRQLADAIFDIDRRLTGVERTPQLGNSSLEDTGINVYDSENNLTVTVGKQPDGTFGATPVRGPVPPMPEGIEAEGDAGVLRASWDGSFRDEAAKPLDFAAVEVLVDGVVRGALHDPLGGSVTVPAVSGERVVSFRTLSQAGKHSEAVGHVTVTVEPRVSAQMLELGEDLAELNDVVLPELADDLEDARTDLQQKLDAANQRIDDIVIDGGGGAGNFTTYSVNEPSGEGTGSGDQWFRVVNGEVLGQWQWDGETWAPVTLTDAVIAGIDLSKIVSNGNLSEVVASKMFTDIFTANKITSQEIAAGSITTEKISSEGIIADVIQGGSFIGETFEGGEFIGGEFRTSDDLPGQVKFSDTAYAGMPGLSVTPTDSADYAVEPAIGPTQNGIVISGGDKTDGTSAFGTFTTERAMLESRTPANESHIKVERYLAQLESVNPVGDEFGRILTRPGVASINTVNAYDARAEVMVVPGNTSIDTESASGSRGSLMLSEQSVAIESKSDSGNKVSLEASSEGTPSLRAAATGTAYGSGSLYVDNQRSHLRADGSGGKFGMIAATADGADITFSPGDGSETGIAANATDSSVFSSDGTGKSSYITSAPGEVGIGAEDRESKDGPLVQSSTINLMPDSASLTSVSGTTFNSKIQAGATEASLYSRAGGTNRYLTVDAAGVWAKQGSDSVSLIPEVRQFQYSALWNADQSPAHIMVQHLPGGKLCQAQIRIQNLTGSKLSLPYDDWVLLNYNPIPADLRGGYTDYIEVTLPQLNARGRVEMNYSTGRIRVKALEKDSNGNGVTINWNNNSSIWFPMRWFSPDSASL